MTITLSAIHLYPVKALGGISLQASALTPRGLRHDRRFMVVDSSGGFLTQREYSQMATVWTDIENDRLTLAAPDLDAVEIALEPEGTAALRCKVRVWKSLVDAEVVSEEANRFLSDYLKVACKLVYMPESSRRGINPEYAGENDIVSFADGFPILLTAESSLADLNGRIEAQGRGALPMNRFRPNLVIAGSEPYAEDTWKKIRIGAASFTLAKACIRCEVPTIDQASGERRGPEPLATLVTYRDTPNGVSFGQNLIATELANIRVGDVVEVLA